MPLGYVLLLVGFGSTTDDEVKGENQMNVISVSLFGLLMAFLPLAALIIGIVWISRVVKRYEKRADKQLYLERQHAKQFQIMIERIEQQLDTYDEQRS